MKPWMAEFLNGFLKKFIFEVWLAWQLEEITRHAMIICDQRPPGAHKEEPLGDKWKIWMMKKVFCSTFFSSKKAFITITSFKSFTFKILCSDILLIFSTYPAVAPLKGISTHPSTCPRQLWRLRKRWTSMNKLLAPTRRSEVSDGALKSPWSFLPERQMATTLGWSNYRRWQKVNLALLLCHVVQPEKTLPLRAVSVWISQLCMCISVQRANLPSKVPLQGREFSDTSPHPEDIHGLQHSCIVAGWECWKHAFDLVMRVILVVGDSSQTRVSHEGRNRQS